MSAHVERALPLTCHVWGEIVARLEPGVRWSENMIRVDLMFYERNSLEGLPSYREGMKRWGVGQVVARRVLREHIELMVGSE